MNKHRWGRLGALLVLGLATCEVLIMISPFAGFFYATFHFESLLGFLSKSPATAWLNGFFLNHSAVTTSPFLEGQREAGIWIFSIGLWGFLIAAVQVYGRKILGKGVAKGLLYRFCRHPQYFFLGLAGLGLLTVWPRFLLLGLWVTMLFLYAGLARFEEARMQERYGDDYQAYAGGHRGFFLGGLLHSIFVGPFLRMRPRAIRWLTAWLFSLAVAFSVAWGLHDFTESRTVIVQRPDDHAVVISAWPEPEAWVNRTFEAALADPRTREPLGGLGGQPLVATILPPKYVMKGMYYKMPPGETAAETKAGFPSALKRIGWIFARFLVPMKGVIRSDTFMGVAPDENPDQPVEVILSRARKLYKSELPLDEALDPGVVLTPLAVAVVEPATGKVTAVRIPLPQNQWGPEVVMPLF